MSGGGGNYNCGMVVTKLWRPVGVVAMLCSQKRKRYLTAMSWWYGSDNDDGEYNLI